MNGQEAAEVRPVCQICGVDTEAPDSTLTRTSAIASTGLKRLPEPGLEWLRKTYGLVPTLTCAACFLPALEGANQTIWMASQA